MISFKNIMAIAGAERRINRRLVRYWFFVGLAYLISFILFAQLTAVHGLYSSYSGTVGAISPRFLLNVVGLIYSIVFLVGTIFLAFDVRARDRRERMVEVLDSRPFTNLELVSGRFFGIFMSSWIPMIVMVALYEIIGILLRTLGAPVGEAIEIYSIFSYIFLMAVPALSFVIALVFFITLLVRNRLASAVILIALLSLIYWAMFGLPAYLGVLFDITGIGASFFSSEILHSLASPDGWLQRTSVLLAAFALLGLSAAIHPRLDGGSRLKTTMGSILILCAAVFLSGAVYFKTTGTVRQVELWKEAHAAHADEPVPDLKKISGNVRIDPGKELLLDLDVSFEIPEKAASGKALFTLNPGQKVKSIKDISGKDMGFTYENGLLSISLPPTPGQEEVTVHMSIQGLPVDSFAFLESAFDIMTLNNPDSGDIGLFGIAPGIFHKDFIALMPGQRWLPVSGPEKGRDDPRIRPVDFFNVDLNIDLPEGWLAAGPGRRHKTEGNSEGVSFRFSPSAPVPEVALIASKFESRAVEAEGVTLEILVKKRHMNNMKVLAETGDTIKEWIGNRLKDAEGYGLPYPYDAITLVEVPNTLRTYGGGWRMDTVMAPPGLLLMREIGFPTSRFDVAFAKADSFKNREGGIRQAKWERLKTYFSNDFTGGNIFSGAARNFFLNQTAAGGPEGLVLNYVMENLTNLLITGSSSYFSAHLFRNENGLDRIISRIANTYNREPGRNTSIVDETVQDAVSRPDIWERALDVSLRDMDPWEDPARTVDILTLKANAVAKVMMDTLGTEKTGKLLAALRDKNLGRSFSMDDIIVEGKRLGHDFNELLGDWLGSTDLPGFVCEKAEIYRIEDSEGGNPRFQMLFQIRNDEPAPGFLRLISYYVNQGGRPDPVKSEPIRIEGKSAIQFGAVVSNPPATIMLDPYLSLNRSAIYLTVDRRDRKKEGKTEILEGVKKVPFSLPDESYVIVDDLDTGFSVAEDEKKNGFRLMSRKNNKRITDQGLPLTPYYRVPKAWSRVVYTSSYGTYRQTCAVIAKGEGNKKALLKTELKNDGQWDLDIHLPYKANLMPGKKWGTYYLLVTDSNGDKHEIKFDSNTAKMGWNLAESLFLPKGQTTVAVPDKTDGDMVVVDAIKWTPSAGG